jgi:hypothetical protein
VTAAARNHMGAHTVSPTWTVRLVDSGHELGTVEAQLYEEALGKAIALASKIPTLPPQALHVQKQEG